MADRVVSYSFRGNFTQLTAGLTAAGRSVNDLGVKMTAVDKNGQKMRRGFDEVGKSAGKFGLVAAAGLGAVVLASAKFDSAMSKVDAATHETAANLDLLRAAAIKAGADTVFSATEAADAVTALAKAGVSTNDILGGGLAGALALASAGELDVATAADIAATAMNQFGLAGKDIPHIADLLAAAAGKAQGEVSDMAQAFKFVGPVANQMGISIEETAGTIAELAKQGILADQAGTSLRGILTALSSPSKIAAQEMKNLGINLYDARGQFVGFKGVAGQLQSSLRTLSDAERDQALGRLFGNEQITAARILYAGGAADVAKWTKAVDDEGFAADTAARKMNNLKGDFEQFTGSLQTLLITAGDGAQGPLRELTQGATNAVNALNALPAGAKNATTGLLGLAAITGGGLFLGSLVVGRIAATKLALQELGVSAAQARGAMASIGKGFAVGATLLAIQQIVDALGHNFADNDLSRNLAALANGSDAYSENFKGLASDLARVNSRTEGLTEGLSETASAFGLFGDTNLDKAQKNIDAIDQALASLVESGSADEAAAAMEEFVRAAEKNGTSAADTIKNFDAYRTALENVADTADTTRTPLSLLSGEFLLGAFKAGAATAEFNRHNAALKANKAAMDENRKVAHETGEDFIGLGKDVDNAKVSLDDWVRQLEIQAAALTEFGENAKAAAEKGLRQGLIKELEDAGPAGALRLAQLANASEAEVRRASRAWDAGREAIKKYTDTVGGVPPAEIKVTGVPKVKSDIAQIIAALRAIPDNVDIRTNIAMTRDIRGGRDGDPKTPYFDGGFTGYGDPRAPAGVVHGREYVFSAAATQGNERALDALHRSLRGYATGGYVGTLPAGGGAGIDYQRLATAVLNARPLMGNVTVQDGTDFMRVLSQAQRLSASDGIQR